jgi:Gnt-I system high-affinity gluconate transporter
MPLLIVAAGVVLLLVLMTRLKVNAFVAILAVALLVGIAQGMSPVDTYESMVDGVGGQLGELVLILGLGAMFGRVLADSGAAQRIAGDITARFGVGRVQLAMMLTATLIGITMFYEVGFVLLIPLVFTIVRRYQLPLLWVALPMSMTLSTMHSFLPPHPGPATVATTFGASQGLTLLYGLIIAVPAAAVIAYVWPRLPFVRRINPSIPAGLVTEKDYPNELLPGLARCVLIVAVPVLLMAGSAAAELWIGSDSMAFEVLEFFGEAPVALAIALMLGVVFLGSLETGAGVVHQEEDEQSVVVDERLEERVEETVGARAGGSARGAASTVPATGGGAGGSAPRRNGRGWEGYQAAMSACADAVKPMAMILMIIGAGGAFKQVLTDSGIADYITDLTHGWDISPIVLAWLIAVLLRVSLGSATVTVVTASGIVAPLVVAGGASPELMTLAVTCGSICASHVNDPGFWLFKEYLNLSVVDTIKVRTTYTTALALIGLVGVLSLNAVVG